MFKIYTILLLTFFVSNLHAFEIKNAHATLDKLDEYEVCHKYDSQGDICQRALNDWLVKNPDDTFKAAKLTRRMMNPITALPLFYSSFQKKLGDCKDPDLKLSVTGSLELGPNEEAIKQIKALGFEYCYEDLKIGLRSAARASDSAYVIICHELADKKLMAASEKCK